MSEIHKKLGLPGYISELLIMGGGGEYTHYSFTDYTTEPNIEISFWTHEGKILDGNQSQKIKELPAAPNMFFTVDDQMIDSGYVRYEKYLAKDDENIVEWSITGGNPAGSTEKIVRVKSDKVIYEGWGRRSIV